MTGGLSVFGTDPWWMVLLKSVAIFVMLVLLTLFTIWWERRVVSRMQNRIGPNRVGPAGLLQSLMDGIKLGLKEEIIPKAAHLAVYWIAPVISATMAFVAFAVIPFGPTVSIFGVETPLQLTDFPVSVLYVLAIASIGIYDVDLRMNHAAASGDLRNAPSLSRPGLSPAATDPKRARPAYDESPSLQRPRRPPADRSPRPRAAARGSHP
ncbi:MAG: complex I subunit 1/NuoH family protein, partial [Actinomycetales bacterium]